VVVVSGSFSLSGLRLLLLAVIGWGLAFTSSFAGTLDDYVVSLDAGSIMPGADHIGEEQTTDHLVPVYSGSNQLGYIFLNSDWANSVG